MITWRNLGSVSSLVRIGLVVTTAALFAAPRGAGAYGTAGHRIAGLAAEPLLCQRTVAEINELTSGEPFSELGLWADRIRGVDRWARSAPWHYMNITDDAKLEDFQHPPEGDVLWAIEEFSSQLANTRLRQRRRAEALRFLVHFIVDIHQPLHVGRAEDRGGNRTMIRYGNTEVNLHRFWDRDAIELAGLSVAEYADAIRQRAALVAANDTNSAPLDWAEESFEMRGAVYRFSRNGASRRYLGEAEQATRERLAQAAARLANTLNGIFCE